MLWKKKWCIYLVAAGWGLARTFDSDYSSLSRVERPAKPESGLNVPGFVNGINQRFAKEETLAL